MYLYMVHIQYIYKTRKDAIYIYKYYVYILRKIYVQTVETRIFW